MVRIAIAILLLLCNVVIHPVSPADHYGHSGTAELTAKPVVSDQKAVQFPSVTVPPKLEKEDFRVAKVLREQNVQIRSLPYHDFSHVQPFEKSLEHYTKAKFFQSSYV
ncbi:hypothetical protein EQV77_06235 [Halobacillus fulvus]|nr:hypothetical protein EQV77_06235 [Halobacillus fulvus]